MTTDKAGLAAPAKVVTIIHDPARECPVVIVWKAARAVDVSVPFRDAGREIRIGPIVYREDASPYGVALSVPAAPAWIFHPKVGPNALWEFVAHVVAQIDEAAE